MHQPSGSFFSLFLQNSKFVRSVTLWITIDFSMTLCTKPDSIFRRCFFVGNRLISSGTLTAGTYDVRCVCDSERLSILIGTCCWLTADGAQMSGSIRKRFFALFSEVFTLPRSISQPGFIVILFSSKANSSQNYLLVLGSGRIIERDKSYDPDANESHGNRCRILKNPTDDRNRVPRRRSSDS
jgi:hypothetical protein